MKKMKPTACLVLAAFFCANLGYAAPDVPQKVSGTVTLDADGIFLKDVLRVLSEQSKTSFVASEDVETKRVNLSFDRVPLEDALQSIAIANNLRYERRSGNVIVFYAPKSSSGIPGLPGSISGGNDTGEAAPAVETRIYHLKYGRLSISPIDVGGAGTIQDLASLQKASFDSGSGASGSGSGGTSGSSSSGSTPGAAPTTGASGSTTPANLVAERGIDRVVASLLTPAGKVTDDIQSNSLIITDIPSKLDEIEKVLAQIDRPSPQVVLEVYLMEVKKDILVNHGVEWGGTDGALGSFAGGSRTTGFPFTEQIFNGVQSKATDQGTSALTLGTLSANDFQATLHFLTQDINTKILARPRVLTMSNEAANIKLVTNAAIANQTSLTSAQGQATSTANTAERSEVGITLKMTPQVNDDQTVGLFLEPSITTVAASSFFPTVFLDPTTRVVRTVARVKNHQTLVIGGLMDKSGGQNIKKLPFLGDIPGAGAAFRYNNQSDTDRELIIFITPHIVQNYDSFNDEALQPQKQRDVAMQEVLNQFEESEMRIGLDVAEAQEKKKDFAYRQENFLMEKSAQKQDSPKLDREMSGSLQNYGK